MTTFPGVWLFIVGIAALLALWCAVVYLALSFLENEIKHAR